MAPVTAPLRSKPGDATRARARRLFSYGLCASLGLGCASGFTGPDASRPSPADATSDATVDASVADEKGSDEGGLDDAQAADALDEGGRITDVLVDKAGPRDRAAADRTEFDAASCACSQKDATDYSTVERPIECLCGSDGSTCRNWSEVDFDVICPGVPPGDLVLRTGCGQILLHNIGPVISESKKVYDAASGQLIGASEGSDYPHGECHAFGYAYGESFDTECPEITTCYPCRSDDAGRPACP